MAITLAERPDLRDKAIPDAGIWPEFNPQGETYRQFWSRLPDEFSEFQFAMCDEQTGDAHTVPCWWDRTLAGLPGGFDATIADAFKRRDANQPFNTLCAIAAEIPKGGRGGGLAAEILKAMGDIAVRHGFTQLIAPVRPTLKDRYPNPPTTGSPPWAPTHPLKELVRLAKIRWRIEHDYRELKTVLGLDHFEGRYWTGWHHHATLVSAAHSSSPPYG